MTKRVNWLAALLIGAACGGTSEIDLPEPASVEAVAATNGQSAPAGARLPQALAVIVRAADGTPVPRGDIEWSVTSGTGADLSDQSTTSDGTGRAAVTFRLGPTVGEYTVRATLVANRQMSVEFTATATDPPQLSSVTPSTFTGGDTVTIAGSALSGALVVEIGSGPARVLTIAADGSSVTAVVPACLMPGAVSIVVRIDLATSNALTGTYESTGQPLALAAGDYASVDPAQVGTCAIFPDAGVSGAEYMFGPQSVTGTTGQSASYRLRGNAMTTVVAAPRRTRTPPTHAMRFHDALRAREAEFAQLPKPPLEPELLAPAAQAAQPDIGDRRNFRVCRIVTCSAVDDFERVTAEVMFVGDHAVVYQDLNAPANGLTPSDFGSLGQMFDDDLYEVNARAFGAESDVDRNGRVVILMTPVVNGLTTKAECEIAIITGFFFALDVDPAFRNDERSNQAEVFYTLVADPTGSVTCEHSVDRIRRLVPVTFIHELQHMISYNQHVLRRRGNSEVLWMNEAMSHLAEELGALHFLDQGNDQQFSRFAIGNLFNAFLYLKDPGAEFLLPSQGTGSLEERGAGWLFLRWVVDQFGDEITRRLVETSLTGAANVQQATGESMAKLLAQWFLANYVSDLPNFTPDGRLQYTTWAFRTTYESLNEQAPDDFDRPYPLVPDSVGATFQRSGTLRSGSGEYIRVVLGPLERGFTLEFTDDTGGTIDPVVVPRLNVIRIR